MGSTLKDGELLPIVGGPHNGGEAPVKMLFLFVGGGIPSRWHRFGKDWYMLDKDNRRWVYAVEVKAKK